jgi:hypothetical protein
MWPVSAAPGLTAGMVDGLCKELGANAAFYKARKFPIGTRTCLATAKRVVKLGMDKGAKATLRLEFAGKGIFFAKRARRSYELMKTKLAPSMEAKMTLGAKIACGGFSGVAAWVTMCLSDALLFPSIAGNLTGKTTMRLPPAVAGPGGAVKVAFLAALFLPALDTWLGTGKSEV